MSSLSRIIREVRDRVRFAQGISLFLDFDGTLVPIAADPMEPRLDRDAGEALRLIAKHDFLAVAVISGRAVEDLYGRIRIEGIVYAGNHGLEIFGRGLRFVEPLAWSHREQLGALAADLRTELESATGVLVEHKGLTASIHYRGAAAQDIPKVHEAVEAAVARHDGLFRMNAGSMVFEIVPRTNWHKGAAALWINSQLSAGPRLSIFAGDDSSDENAFDVLPEAITIKVGKGATNARYRLPNPLAVRELICWLASMETSRGGRA